MTDTLRARSRRTSEPVARHNGSSADHDRARRFRPSPRRRNRIAAGVALGAAAIGGNVLVYSSLNEAAPVVQVVRDVAAGEQIRPEMMRTVEADVDGSVNVIPGDQLEALIGQYARVRLASGSLVSAQSVQPTPLVEPGNAVVAIRVPEGALPVGLRERVPIQLVVPAPDSESQPIVIEGDVVALPSQPDSLLGTLSLSVELDRNDAAMIAAADDVRVVLLAPDLDEAGDS